MVRPVLNRLRATGFQRIPVLTTTSKTFSSPNPTPTGILNSADISTTTGKNQPNRRPPPGSWDTHLHVLPPTDQFPISKDAVYAPDHIAPLSDVLALSKSTGIPNLVFTQVSIYGYDNSAQISAANSLPSGAKGRVVIGLDPSTVTSKQLDEWHAQGVRGVRLNLRSVKSTLSGPEFIAQLNQIITKIKHLDWVLQLHIDLSLVPQLAPLLQAEKEYKIKIVLDHFAGLDRPFTSQTNLSAQKGWTELKQFLATNENFYVKLSAPYRIVAPEDTTYAALERPFKELAALRNGRGVMYASDWPHTRFEDKANVSVWVDRCLEWCEGDTELENKLFRENAERVWS